MFDHIKERPLRNSYQNFLEGNPSLSLERQVFIGIPVYKLHVDIIPICVPYVIIFVFVQLLINQTRSTLRQDFKAPLYYIYLFETTH